MFGVGQPTRDARHAPCPLAPVVPVLWVVQTQVQRRSTPPGTLLHGAPRPQVWASHWPLFQGLIEPLPSSVGDRNPRWCCVWVKSGHWCQGLG